VNRWRIARVALIWALVVALGVLAECGYLGRAGRPPALAQELEPRAYLPLAFRAYTPPGSYLEWTQRVIERGQEFYVALHATDVGRVERMDAAWRWGPGLLPLMVSYGDLWPPLASVRAEPEWGANHVYLKQIGIVPSPQHQDVVLTTITATADRVAEDGIEVAPAAVLRGQILTEVDRVYVVKCLGDFNHDGVRDNKDRIAFYLHIGEEYDPLYDINGDGMVTMADYRALDGVWYEPCS